VTRLNPDGRYPPQDQDQDQDRSGWRCAGKSVLVREVRVGPTVHAEIARLAMRYLLGDLRLDEVGVDVVVDPLRA
jgi:hypothetical protein